MPKEQRCPQCGAELSAFATEGFCTACLLERGLSSKPHAAAPPLSRIGDYELIEEIARGGMGVVYKARQTGLNRVVAVKMILSGQFASAAEMQRFRAEARAAAALQHPGIVAIHEVGEYEGLLFFSMDYVEGRNLAQLTRDGPWSAARAAQCVRDIAEAIHYAHERGVLHRDLKPSNVLVDADGKPRVTDFGLAKRLPNSEPEAQHSELTLSGQVLGSPNFMPPEQAAGRHRELTPASDVYSVGALLYHLITGRAPFLADNIPATLRLVSEADPVAPRLLAPGVPRDLETICLKCLEKDPQRRYAAAQDLAEELGRFLRDEPIHARPIGAPAKVWRWCRRNPGLARTAAAALLLFLVVVVAGPIAIVQINRARRHAEARQKEATLEAIKSQQVAQFLTEMLSSAGPSVARGRDATLLRELLEKTAERLDKDLRNQPEVQGDMSVTLGNTYRDMGDYQHAIPMFEKAVAAYRQAFGGVHKKLALALARLGSAQSFDSDLTAGKRHAQLGLEMAREGRDPEAISICLMNMARSVKEFGMTSPEGLPYAREAAELWRKLGNNPGALADCLSFMAGAMQDSDLAEAERLAREAFAINSANLEPDHPSVLGDIFVLGQIQLDRGKFAEAETNLKETLRRHRKIYDQNHPYRFVVISLLGDALKKQGKLAEFEALYREALTLEGDTPNSIDAVDKLASLLRDNGKRSESDELIRETVSKWKKNRGTNDLVLAYLFNTLTNRAAGEEKFSESATLGREALAIQLRLASNNLPQIIATAGGLAATLDHAGKYAEAEPLLERRLEFQRALYRSNDLRIAGSLVWLTWVFVKDGKLPEAEPYAREALAIQRAAAVSNPSSLRPLIQILDQQGKREEANELIREHLSFVKSTGKTNDLGRAHELNSLADRLVEQKKYDKAEPYAQEAFTIQQRLATNNSSTLNTLIQILDVQGKTQEVQNVIGDYLSLLRSAHKTNDFAMAESLNSLATGLAEQKQFAEAEPLAREALAIHEAIALQKNASSSNLGYRVRSLRTLVRALAGQQKFAEAETRARDLVEFQEKTFGKANAETISALGDLSSLLVKQSKYTDAAGVWTALIDADPTNAATYRKRGEIFGRTGRWKEAAADLAKALELQLAQQQPSYELAALLVQAGDLEAYRKHREAMLTRFQETADPLVARAIVRACLLLPASDEQLPVIGRLAESALVKENSWMEFAKGLAEYRQGRFASVLDWMKKALVRPPNDRRDAAAWTVLAMAHHQLKQPDEARAAFAKGKEIIEAKLPRLNSGDLGATWGDVLIAHILKREAEELIKDDPSKTGGSKAE